MQRLQRTIKAAIHCEGIGLHTGRKVRMSLKPAPVDAGILFKRTDLGGTEIKAVAAALVLFGYGGIIGFFEGSVDTD